MASSAPDLWTDKIPNQSPRLVVVSALFGLVTTLVVIFRFAWRWAHRQRGLDDGMALGACAILAIQTIFGGIAAHYGFGKHMADIKPTFTLTMEYFYLYQICYKLLGGFTKLNFCALYLRIFAQKNFQRFVLFIALITAAGSLAFALGTVFQCTPVHRAWDKKVPGHCISNTGFWYAHAAFNTFMDIVIYIMPIPLISGLKLARGQKTGLITIFSLGAFVIAASIVRMVMLRSSATTTDPTWGSTEALMWTEIEANTSVICCCLPALRVPFLNLWHRIRGGGRSPSTSQTKDQGLHNCAWSGPHRNTAAAVSRPRPVYESKGKSSHSHPSVSNAPKAGGDTWYDRVLQSLGIDKDEFHSWSSSSQDELAKTEDGLPPTLELGAIYKTTDVHVSTSDVNRGPKRERQLSLQDMLNER